MLNIKENRIQINCECSCSPKEPRVYPGVSIQRIGLGAKETVVLIEKLRVLYGIDADKQIRYEVGLESFSEFDREIALNVHYKTTLGVFVAFNKPESPDLLWENFVTMKVNIWLSVNFEWVVLYDTDVSSKTQFREVFSVGVSYILL